ncbi:hypothetical protein EW145_g2536 [Phellinidium pouzarii]|uniref:Cell division control protein 73 C-terminal domain-containing protein n=1 Tax=Phellinidium pouzarii TaxID=167371 RepID=A0A4S4LCH0_9AGAM|nr:hypothetical protein EW145_g2536 [Phellinidium pouzarii]
MQLVPALILLFWPGPYSLSLSHRDFFFTAVPVHDNERSPRSAECPARRHPCKAQHSICIRRWAMPHSRCRDPPRPLAIAFPPKGLADASPQTRRQRALPPRRPRATFFRLDAVLLAWLLRDASAAEYMKEARENGLLGAFVSNTERKGVAEWLDGKTRHYKGIVSLQSDSTTPPGTPPQKDATLPAAAGQSGIPSSTAPAKRRHVVDAADAEIVKKIRMNEVELSDRTSILRGTKPNNFNNVRIMYAEKLKKLKEASKGGTVSHSTTAPKMDMKAQARKARNMQPIIMISSSPTSLITMYNVRLFLQEATFENPTDARARANAEGNTRPEDMIPIYRKHTHIDSSGQERETQAKYLVVDGVEALAKFGTDAWDRVVAVLTTGQAWQFKPYKWAEPKTLFHHVKGFYVSWANDPPNVKIKDWNVTELKARRQVSSGELLEVAGFMDIGEQTVAHKVLIPVIPPLL